MKKKVPGESQKETPKKEITLKAGRVKTHKVHVPKPFVMKFPKLLKCPFCENTEEFYEVIENATFYTYLFQKEDGTFEPIDEEVEVLGPVRFFCGKCHAELTHLKELSESMDG